MSDTNTFIHILNEKGFIYYICIMFYIRFKSIHMLYQFKILLHSLTQYGHEIMQLLQGSTTIGSKTWCLAARGQDKNG